MLAFAVATCGWFLMMAPPVGESLGLDVNKPLSEWIIVRAFDSAAECEKEREKHLADTMKNVAKNIKPPAKKGDVVELKGEDAKLALEGLRLFICLPSEKIPLKRSLGCGP